MSIKQNIKAALLTELDKVGLGMPVVYPNNVGSIKNPPYAEVSLIFSPPVSVTIGVGGEDEQSGILQVLFKFALETGDYQTYESTDLLEEHFVSGLRCTYGKTIVNITSCGTGISVYHEGKYVTPVSIYWYSRNRRRKNG